MQKSGGHIQILPRRRLQFSAARLVPLRLRCCCRARLGAHGRTAREEQRQQSDAFDVVRSVTATSVRVDGPVTAGTSSSGSGSSTAGDQSATQPLRVTLTRRNRRIRVGRNGVFSFMLGAQAVDAAGRAGFSLRLPQHEQAAGARTVSLRSKAFVSTAGLPTRISARLTTRQRRILKAARRLRVTATISVHDPAGRAARRSYHFALLAPR